MSKKAAADSLDLDNFVAATEPKEFTFKADHGTTWVVLVRPADPSAVDTALTFASDGSVGPVLGLAMRALASVVSATSKNGKPVGIFGKPATDPAAKNDALRFFPALLNQVWIEARKLGQIAREQQGN